VATPVDWGVVAFSTLGGTIAGSLLTTFFNRQGQQRSARADVRRLIQRTEVLSRQPGNEENKAAFEADLDELEAACMLLGRNIRWRAGVYRAVRWHTFTCKGEEVVAAQGESGAGVAVVLGGFVAAGLLADAVRHPWLCVFKRHRIRVAKCYLKVMNLSIPEGTQKEIDRDLEEWMKRAERNRQLRAGPARPSGPGSQQ
jgi:hypothetical protein